ncbi:formate dehydrogenase accessory protein FdhE [Gulbenkiania indica]|uniref:Protein FdhE homolog n=1 Tax=Gulbenkiania indica TaxID=375574 RepID=A0A0K6H345_9NEIS|nr:formate dehydrogenase accessory protein FdhE [Gulbenkiania indica]CUA85144.1 formate dehydrogenase accessory protein FdhE [Gulbenkiania indica]
MSIRIVPVETLVQQPTGLEPLLLPRPTELYRARAARLHSLAAQHPMGDYLRLAARIVEAQLGLVIRQPVLLPERGDYFRQCAEHGLPPLGAVAWPREALWREGLRALCRELAQALTGPAAEVAARLAEAPDALLEGYAQDLLSGQYERVPAGEAPFVWAALAAHFSQLASQLKVAAIPEPGDHRHLCPVCGSAPVASMQQIGARSGLRYLHCGLCESEWHLVRAKCSNCEDSRDLGYWSLDDREAAVRAESCGACGSYLKLVSLDRDAAADAVADDLATLALDARMEEEGFARSSLNPFLFPG